MWRLASLKTFVCLTLSVLAFVTLIITHTQSFGRIIPNGKLISGQLDNFGTKDEDGMQYYQNSDDVRPQTKNNPDLGPDAKFRYNYPFDDNDEGAAPAANEDFDDGQNAVEKQSGRNAKISNYPQHQLNDIVSDITCDINNGKYVIDCKKDDHGQVFIPFSFIHQYFEIYGEMSKTDPNKFMWLHSQVKIFRPKQPYNPRGVFTFFENYNVEVRDRVKCVSGAFGVPVSTQWDPAGYFYPIQIAQFGLSHYSKNIVEGEPTRIPLENGDSTRGNWVNENGVKMDLVSNSNNNVLEVYAAQSRKNHVRIQKFNGKMHDYDRMDGMFVGNHEEMYKLAVRNHKSRFLHLSWSMRIKTNDKSASPINVTVIVDVRYEKQVFRLHYVTADFFIKTKDNNIYHGLGYQSTTKWQHFIRDLGVDVQKGVAQYAKRKSSKILKSKLVVESITITNNNANGASILFDNMTLSTSEHVAQFFQAVDWFVLNQDERGGWSIPVKRKFGAEFHAVLKPGWYSSMAMGHGLSLLSRAYAMTKNPIYAEACAKAVETIFDSSGDKNQGVKAVFMNQYTWYEEYPTTPSTFVLNGFMYSLLGLYDAWQLQVPRASDKARLLYEDGLHSLITMLPLYDTGSGTMYDLRHFTVPAITPNLARLDYHVTHINQLLTFATINDNKIFSTTAERWIGYTEGNRAPHN